MIHPKYDEMKVRQDLLIQMENEIDATYINGIYNRYVNPVVTRAHVPLHWRYDLDEDTNPYFMECLGVNATLNPGAIYHEGEFYLVVRMEGVDRKSVFALVKSDNGIYCSESKDPDAPAGDPSMAMAAAGIVRTKDMKTWVRLPNLKTKSAQQRNVVLHPEYVDGKYALYTRPQDGFITSWSIILSILRKIHIGLWIVPNREMT